MLPASLVPPPPPPPTQPYELLKVDRTSLQHDLVRECQRMAAAHVDHRPGYPLPHESPAEGRPWQDVVRGSRTKELKPADRLTCATALCVPCVRAAAKEHVEAVLLNQSRCTDPHGMGTRKYAQAHLQVEASRPSSGPVHLRWIEDACRPRHPRFGDHLTIFVGLMGMSTTPWDGSPASVPTLGHVVMVSDDRPKRALDVIVIGHWSTLPTRTRTDRSVARFRPLSQAEGMHSEPLEDTIFEMARSLAHHVWSTNPHPDRSVWCVRAATTPLIGSERRAGVPAPADGRGDPQG